MGEFDEIRMQPDHGEENVKKWFYAYEVSKLTDNENYQYVFNLTMVFYSVGISVILTLLLFTLTHGNLTSKSIISIWAVMLILLFLLFLSLVVAKVSSAIEQFSVGLTFSNDSRVLESIKGPKKFVVINEVKLPNHLKTFFEPEREEQNHFDKMTNSIFSNWSVMKSLIAHSLNCLSTGASLYQNTTIDRSKGQCQDLYFSNVLPEPFKFRLPISDFPCFSLDEMGGNSHIKLNVERDEDGNETPTSISPSGAIVSISSQKLNLSINIDAITGMSSFNLANNLIPNIISAQALVRIKFRSKTITAMRAAPSILPYYMKKLLDPPRKLEYFYTALTENIIYSGSFVTGIAGIECEDKVIVNMPRIKFVYHKNEN